jgi:hypothetical protein
VAISANPCLKEKTSLNKEKKTTDQGEAWSQKAILQLWEFSREMWEHRNVVLHNAQLEES